MPANLSNPFGESCCDGGECNTKESAQPCGCDLGCKPPHYCEGHRYIRLTRDEVKELIEFADWGLAMALKLTNSPEDWQDLMDRLKEKL